jgi:two-component system chemotaxis response regulator CheY
MAHVLVVDDSSVARDFVAAYLSRHGFEVTTAADGRQGLDRLRDDPAIRLVVSDVNMPNMDGIAMAA